ncbi:MAG: DUF4982 domain-containing protein [Lachnospiraceae bacterium]|nr:DUF4982 domain-containing protein [Lachnospiraceae bacterium]
MTQKRSIVTSESNPYPITWCFHHGDMDGDPWQISYAEDIFEPVTVPHDWSVAFPFSKDCPSGTGYVKGGIGWYRGHFSLPQQEEQGCRFFLSFDGVYKHAYVYINGIYKGFHANGFTPFSFDVTEEIRPGQDNVIAVKVDHTDSADCRWFTGSGIIRKVRLVESEPIYILPSDIAFRTISVSGQKARVEVRSILHNVTDTAFCGKIQYQLIPEDPSGDDSRPHFPHSQAVTPGEADTGEALHDGSFSCVSSLITCPAHQTAEYCQQLELDSALLWSPAHPNLYQLSVLPIAEAEETAVSGVSIEVGVRKADFDPDHGFCLNGESMKLKGVCVHDDCGALGAAATEEIWYRRLEKLRKMGCNAIRMSHNPHMQELYSLCDRLGFLVMDEAFDEWELPKNKWTHGHNVYPPAHEGYYLDFPANHQADLRAMIERDRNHPCVILWSIGNEIDYPNDPYCHPLFQTMTGNNDANKPAAERMYNPNRPNAERLRGLAAMLASEVRSLDKDHPVTLAAAFPELSARVGFLDALDVAGYNYKEHLYAESHRDFSRLPFLGSENSHSFEAWKAVRDCEYISGQFLWTGIDYLGETRGWPARASGAGLLDLGGFEKPDYSRRKSYWSEEPVLSLVTFPETDDPWPAPEEHWNYLPGEKITVRCHTNLAFAELFLNGKSFGRKETSAETAFLEWTVPFEEGTLSVRSGELVKTLSTQKKAAVLRIKRYEVPAKYVQDPAEQIEQLEITTGDEDGNPVTTDPREIMLRVSGGKLIGMESGDIEDDTPYFSDTRRSFRGHLIAYVRRDGDSRIQAEASSPGLRPALLSF